MGVNTETKMVNPDSVGHQGLAERINSMASPSSSPSSMLHHHHHLHHHHAPPPYTKMEPSESFHHLNRQQTHHHAHQHSSSSTLHRLKRVDTLDLKTKLATALGNNGKRYWSALLDFITAKIDRMEFEQEASLCLKPQHVHLHNSLVLGLLYNASVDVPGPSSPRTGHHKRDANGARIDVNGETIQSTSDDEEEDEPIHRMLAPPEKRLRLLTAGLSRKDRARIKLVPKAMTHSRGLASGATSSLGWAGAGADMLEKKRKEEERRRTIEEKKRVKEVYTQIGAKDWKQDIVSSGIQIASVHERLSLSIQQEIARAQAAPLCIESKELPDLDSMRDLMTLYAVESGLPRGAQPQAAALLLAALQSHLQNVTSSVITKIRANRQMGIRTTDLLRAASDDYNLSPSVPMTQVQQAEDEDESFDLSVRPNFVAKPIRTMASGFSSSLNSSSASLDFSTGTSNSLADSSLISLASTAPTSIPAASVSSEEVGGQGGEARKSGEREEDEDQDQDQINSLASSDQRRENSVAGDNNSLELRHLSFLLNVAPHTVVEPLGLGTQERLLAADWTVADEDALREQEWTNEGMLLRESILAATSKMSSIPSTTPSQRSSYIIDQLAPVRLFDRKTLTETQALHNSSSNSRNTKGGLTLPSDNNVAAKSHAMEGEGDENKNIVSSTFPTRLYNNSHHHHRGLDPHLYDVVDPVALLGSMVN